MNRLRFLLFLGIFVPLFATSAGCEVVANVDRSQIGGEGGIVATGGMGGIGGTGGTGGMACDPASCPAASNECVDVICKSDGTCGESPKADGPAATQVASDCKQSLCKGGQVVDENDDTDVPIDGNDCTDDVCTSGVPSNPFLAIDSACGPNGLSFCDGSGMCGECTTATQCPGNDTECETRTCDMGVCGVSYAMQGTPVAAQTMGDCLQNVCDGTGGMEATPDDVDVMDDGNDCTDNACDMGVNVTTNIALNAACGAGGALYCDGNGGCVTCTDASQCGTPANACLVATCMAGMCGTADKADGTSCDDGNACSQTDTCQAGACTGGNAVVCSALDQCHDAGTCNAATGVCDNPVKADGAACMFPGGSGACTAGTCAASIDYIKASNTDASDQFGIGVAVSADGNTLAISADQEDSNATGIAGDQADNSAADAGAVYVFTRSGGVWVQEAYLKASNAEAGDRFGRTLALSADGNTLAVTADQEDSNATGINGDQSNNSGTGSGAAYVFTRNGGVWSQQAYIKASNTGLSDFYGVSMALSADGDTLAVGATFEDSNATGIDGNQADNSASNTGAVYVYARSGGVWSQQAYVKASNTNTSDQFGLSVALSGDGSTLAVGAIAEDSNATGVDGDQADNSASDAGAVYVFARSGGVWSQQAYVKASNTNASDSFGRSVALSGDGDTLAVGAELEDSNATGIDGDETNNSANAAGAVYLYTRSGGLWSHQAYIKASNSGVGDQFGRSLALSGDGLALAVGAPSEDSNATGINGNQTNNSANGSGAVYRFIHSATWSQTAYVKASNTESSDRFSDGIALSMDGSTLAVGAIAEDSNATGIDGNQADNSASVAGAVYVY